MGYEVQDFQKEVLEASNATPIVIDFWAEWCGPCRQLGPTIEKLANEAGDRWKLVKIDTDKNPDLAVQFGVRGIPAVKMVYQKEIIAEFTGAQPEHRIRQWLKDNLPANGASENGELQNRVKQLIGEGERDQVRELLKDEVSDDASDLLKVMLAMALLPDDIESAKSWFDKVDEPEKFEIQSEALETLNHLREIRKGEAEPPGDNEAILDTYHEAIAALFDHRYEEALEQFIECLQTDREMDDDGARRACVAIFTLLGEQHPLTIQYRRRFSMSLY